MNSRISSNFLTFMLVCFFLFNVKEGQSQCPTQHVIVIADEELIDETITYTGDLIVLQGVTLTLNNTLLQFPPGFGIIVNGTLIVQNGSELTNYEYCGETGPWKGIIAQNNSHTTIDKAIIRNAETGYFSAGGSGNMLYSSSGVFFNNQKGIHIENSNGEIYYNIKNNYFTTDTPNFTQDGIYIKNVMLDDFPYMDGETATIWRNHFINNWNGIRLINVKGNLPLELSTNDFTNMGNLGIRYLNTLSGTALQNLAYISFVDNVMNNVQRGIHNTRSRGEIIGNSIDGFTNFGLRMDAPFLYSVDANDFSSDGSNPYSKGVYISESTSLENQGPFPFPAECSIKDNDFNSSTAGLYFLNYRTDQHLIVVNCNRFTNNGQAIQIQSNTTLSNVESGINVLGAYNAFNGNSSDFYLGFHAELDGYHYIDCANNSCPEMMPAWPPAGPGSSGNLTNDPTALPCASAQRIVKGTATVEPFNVELSPNPTSGKINLDFSSIADQNTRISVIDAMGRQIELLHEGKLTNKNMSLQLNKQPNGIYFLLIQTSEDNLIKKLLIVN